MEFSIDEQISNLVDEAIKAASSGDTEKAATLLDQAILVSQPPNNVTFEIEGELWTVRIPERLYLKTIIDLETGKAEILEG